MALPCSKNLCAGCCALTLLLAAPGCTIDKWAMQAKTNNLSASASGAKAGSSSLPPGYGRGLEAPSSK
jgi:hypothetical protein